MVWDFALSLCWIASWYVMLQHPRSTRHGISVGFFCLFVLFCFVSLSRDSTFREQWLFSNKANTNLQIYKYISMLYTYELWLQREPSFVSVKIYCIDVALLLSCPMSAIIMHNFTYQNILHLMFTTGTKPHLQSKNTCLILECDYSSDYCIHFYIATGIILQKCLVCQNKSHSTMN